MKKFISALTAVVLAAAIVFAFAGCNKSEETVTSTADETPVSDFRLGYVEIIPDVELLTLWGEDRYLYGKIITDEFGLDENKTNSFYESYETHMVYGLSVEIVNNTDNAVDISGIETDSNGKNGVYIRNTFDGGERSIGAHSSDALTLHILCSDEELSDQQIVEAVKSMLLTLVYTQDTEEKKFALRLENGVEVYEKPSGNTETIRIGDTGDFAPSEALWNKYKDDTEANRSALKTGFGVNDDFVSAFYKESESYNFYNYPIRIENISEHDIVIYDITTAENGKNGIYVNIAFNGEMGIPGYDPNANFMLPPFAVQILCVDDLSEDQVKNTVDAMVFSITYAEKAVDGDPDSEEVKEKQTITVTIG